MTRKLDPRFLQILPMIRQCAFPHTITTQDMIERLGFAHRSEISWYVTKLVRNEKHVHRRRCDNGSDGFEYWYDAKRTNPEYNSPQKYTRNSKKEPLSSISSPLSENKVSSAPQAVTRKTSDERGRPIAGSLPMYGEVMLSFEMSNSATITLMLREAKFLYSQLKELFEGQL